MASTDPTDLNRLEREAEAEQAQAREARRKELDDVRWLLGHPQGRRFLARLFGVTGLYRTSFNHSGSVMAFNEGQRQVGLFLAAELTEASSDGFMKVLQEHNRTKQ